MDKIFFELEKELSKFGYELFFVDNNQYCFREYGHKFIEKRLFNEKQIIAVIKFLNKEEETFKERFDIKV